MSCWPTCSFWKWALIAIWRWNPLLHIGQWYGKVFECVVKCSARWSFLKNLFWHTLHSYGFTPVCLIYNKDMLKCSCFKTVREGIFWVSGITLCLLILAPFENFILQTSHSNIFRWDLTFPECPSSPSLSFSWPSILSAASTASWFVHCSWCAQKAVLLIVS